MDWVLAAVLATVVAAAAAAVAAAAVVVVASLIFFGGGAAGNGSLTRLTFCNASAKMLALKLLGKWGKTHGSKADQLHL